MQVAADAGSSLADFSTLKMEAIRSSETSVQSTTSTRRPATCLRWFFARGFFDPEDGGDTILRNVGSIDHIYTAPHSRRRHSSGSILLHESGKKMFSSTEGTLRNSHCFSVQTTRNYRRKNTILRGIWTHNSLQPNPWKRLSLCSTKYLRHCGFPRIPGRRQTEERKSFTTLTSTTQYMPIEIQFLRHRKRIEK
jgi:hypothetical protein